MKRVACAMAAMALPLMPFRSLCMSAEPQPVKRVVTIDTIQDQTTQLMVYNSLIDGAGDFDGDGLSDVVLLADDLDYYLVHGQEGLSGKVLDARALRATTGDIRATRFILPSETPTYLVLGGGGDVTGDGLDDIVLGAAEELDCPEGCPKRYDHPVFYLILGQRGGLPPEADIESLIRSGKAARLLPPEDSTGWSAGGHWIRFIGDVNGDGYGEISPYRPPYDIQGTVVAGRAFVLFGNGHLGGRDIELNEIGRSVAGLKLIATRAGDAAGSTVEGLGDIDGDGYGDIAVSAGGGDGFSQRLYIIYGGRDLGGEYTTEDLPPEWSAILAGHGKPARLGDMNGDGYGDFAVGVGGNTAIKIVRGGQRLHGQVTTGELNATLSVSYIDNMYPRLRDSSYSLGTMDGGIDVNRDGVEDFCYFSGEELEVDAGRTIMVLGRREYPSFVWYDELLQSYAFAIAGANRGQDLGRVSLLLNDFEGDGFGELLLVAGDGPTINASHSYIVPWRSLLSRKLTLNEVDPASGSRLGGDLVTLRGSDFGADMEVRFGESDAEVVSVLNQSWMVVRTPPHEVGTVGVSVGRGGVWARLDSAFTFDDRYTRTVDLGRISGGDGSDGVELHFSAPETSIVSGKLIPDVNGDGRPELALLADPQDGSGDSGLYVILGGRNLPGYLDLSANEEAWGFRMASSPSLRLLGLLGGGDVNGDGIGDLALRTRVRATNEELLVVVPGRTEFGKEIVVDRIDRVTTVRRTAAPCDGFWLSRATVSSDVDGDGLDDILSWDVVESCGGGGAVIVYGSTRFGVEPDLCVEDMLALGEAGRFEGMMGITGAGDIDGNGKKEIALRTLALDIALFDLRDGRLAGSLDLTDELLKGIPCRGYHLIDLPLFPADCVFPGDLDGDGRPDFAMGTSQGMQKAPLYSGAVNIISGAFTKEGVCADEAVWTLYAKEIVGDRVRAGLGKELERAGDWNGDGFEDLLVGAPGYHLGNFPEVDGAAYIIYGSRTILEDELKPYDLAEKGIRFNGAKPGWWIGEKVSGGQDFNGDGLEDVLLTETSYPSGKETGASAYLVYGRSSDAFRRGDANDDGQLDVGDPIFILNFLFANGKRPACLDSADIDDSGDLTIGDPIYLLQYLYSGGPEPKEPFQAAGPDPTPDGLFCSG